MKIYHLPVNYTKMIPFNGLPLFCNPAPSTSVDSLTSRCSSIAVFAYDCPNAILVHLFAKVKNCVWTSMADISKTIASS